VAGERAIRSASSSATGSCFERCVVEKTETDFAAEPNYVRSLQPRYKTIEHWIE
jgi:hypothetical protein